MRSDGPASSQQCRLRQRGTERFQRCQLSESVTVTETSAAALDERQNERRQDQLHGEIELAAGDDDRIGARHEAVGIIDSRYGKSMPRGSLKRMMTIDSSGVGIQRATKGFEVSTVGMRWKLMSVSVNCGQMYFT